MALTKQLEKTTVREQFSKLFIITLKLTITDDEGPGFTRTFSQNYKQGHNIPDIEDKYVEEIQAEIDKYKREQFILKHPQLDTTVTNVESRLVV